MTIRPTPLPRRSPGSISVAASRGIIGFYRYEAARRRLQQGVRLEEAAARTGVTVETLKEWVNPPDPQATMYSSMTARYLKNRAQLNGLANRGKCGGELGPQKTWINDVLWHPACAGLAGCNGYR